MGNYPDTKRKHEDSTLDEKQEQSVVELPKKKKQRTTSDYIYHTLFVNGQDSDVTLVALDIEWKLHKLYLCQSNYFKSMFTGTWKESQQSLIKLEIPDENIDEEALHTAFGSFYCDEVEISSCNVVPLMAVACMFQLDGLLANCAEMMIENLGSETVCRYYTAAIQYGQQSVETKCLEWLERRLTSLERRLTSSAIVELFRNISVDLMEKVIKSPNLFVMQIEVDTYNLAKMWMFLKLNSSWEGRKKDLLSDANAHFQARTGDRAFLETDEGSKYTCVFQAVRLQNVICDVKAVRQLDQDKIIPNGKDFSSSFHVIYTLNNMSSTFEFTI
ncbi:germ cell-less -like 1 [Paramuricea clavata]|uniref:Germ cell-less -like 1 n=2 Tax=Paramuricea clavata TaxID=317549 RepID=A0A6S7GWS3_PARCT|nr:germ cell-less -like 1 [Paramuricea clavata]